MTTTISSNAGRLIVVLAMIVAMVGCYAMSQPTQRTYTGAYYAKAGRTKINLDVKPASFQVATFTEPNSSAALTPASARAANAEDGAPVWVVFTGEVAINGSAVTLTITGVERDGQQLEGAELDRYSKCDITATAGDSFAREVMAGILACLGIADGEDAAVVRKADRRPSDAVLGNWWTEVVPVVGGRVYRVTVSISRTQLTVAGDDVDSAIYNVELRDTNLRVSGTRSDGATISIVVHYVIDGDSMTWNWAATAGVVGGFLEWERA